MNLHRLEGADEFEEETRPFGCGADQGRGLPVVGRRPRYDQEIIAGGVARLCPAVAVARQQHTDCENDPFPHELWCWTSSA